METIEKKYNVREFKAVIKVAVEYQKFLKSQRKTVKLVGNRLMDPNEATWKHESNREKLSAMYVAYGVMRGKNLEEQIKSHISKRNEYIAKYAKTKVDSFLREYMLKEVEASE